MIKYSLFFLLFLHFAMQSFGQNINNLRITEVMYHSPYHNLIGDTTAEFIELKNTASTPLNIGGVKISGAITYTFPSNTTLNTNEIILLVEDSNYFKSKYTGLSIFDEYTLKLSNKGELIQLNLGTDTFLKLKYNDNLPWPVLPDGFGYSLVSLKTNPTGNPSKSRNWKNSTNYGGSPGIDEPLNQIDTIIISELLSHTDLPQTDVVELFNPNGNAVDISGWYISDDKSLRSYKIPQGTVINSNQHLLFDESDFNNGSINSFSFNRSGESVFLSSANSLDSLTGYNMGWEYMGQYNGTSFGTYINSVNETHFVAQEDLSLGSVNNYPKVGPLVFTKIMYNPNSLQDEFLVIRNISGSTINLFSSHTPDTTWRVTGVGFAFSQNLSLTSLEEVILTAINPSTFRTKYDVPTSVNIYQYGGSLRNEGERLRILAPERPDTTALLQVFTPWVVIDEVTYNDKSPWPILADGLGHFLTKNINKNYGNDPAEWSSSDSIVISIAPTKTTSSNYASFYNATNNQLLVNYASPFETQHKIILYNSLGQIVIKTNATTNNFVLNTWPLISGMYVLHVASKSQVHIKKFIIP